jgi:hypothetical protein
MNYIYLFGAHIFYLAQEVPLTPCSVLSVVNVVVLLTAPHGYTTLLTALVLSTKLLQCIDTYCFSLQRVMHSILSGRILLHLRGATRKGNTEIAMLRPSNLFPTMHQHTTNRQGNSEVTNTELDFGEVTDPAGPSTLTRNGREEQATMLEQWFGEIRDRSFDEPDSTELDTKDVGAN